MSASKTEHNEAYFGLFVALCGNNTAEMWGQEPAERKLQERDVFPEKADSHQRQQHATWG